MSKRSLKEQSVFSFNAYNDDIEKIKKLKIDSGLPTWPIFIKMFNNVVEDYINSKKSEIKKGDKQS